MKKFEVIYSNEVDQLSKKQKGHPVINDKVCYYVDVYLRTNKIILGSLTKEPIEKLYENNNLISIKEIGETKPNFFDSLVDNKYITTIVNHKEIKSKFLRTEFKQCSDEVQESYKKLGYLSFS